MKPLTKAVTYGITGLALAGVVILSGTTLGALPITGSSFNPGSSALLSVLLTDPPSVPDGVNAVYLTYTDLGVHVAGLGDSGWVMIGGQGSFESLSLANLTQTIASSRVPSGTYDTISLTIPTVQAEFQGKNYSVAINNERLVVPIAGGLKLNTSSDGVAVIDVQPTVFNLGNQSDPQFMMTSGGKALQIPSTDIRPEMRDIGNRSPLGEKPWFRDLTNHSNTLTIGSASLTPGAFDISLSNPTAAPMTIKMIIITQVEADSKPMNALGRLTDSMIFGVGENGMINPIEMRGTSHGASQLKSVLDATGYQLAANSQVTFSFKGSLPSTPGISTGSSYQVLVMGDHLLAETTVQAG